jgi:transposase-like protein
MHRIREAMQDKPTEQLKGTVEVDETYIGGRYDRRRKRGPYEKQVVMGLIERDGRVEARPIPTPSKKILVGVVQERVAPGAKVYTDELAAYKSVGKTHQHETVSHIALEWVRGDVHTNGIENFWSLFKRGLIGSFHKVSEKHLPRYLNEFTYRQNRRKESNLFGTTVGNLLRGIALQYKTLIASETTPPAF